MASINEKIKHSSVFRVNLYKEGIFWLAYEQSAYYVWLLKGYKPTKKRYKKMNKEVVQIGFPKVDALLENQNISAVTRQDAFISFNTITPIVISKFEIWKNNLKTQLGLQLHPKKIFLQHFSKGVNFLGATLKPHRKYVSNRAKINFKLCVKNWKLFLQNNTPHYADLAQIRASINSYLGIMRHYRTYNIRYNTLIKDRNNLLFQYGYIEAFKKGAMTYKLYPTIN